MVAIAAGGFHNLALTSEGRVIGWGEDFHGQTNVPTSLTQAVAIAAGYWHSLALTPDGRVVAWGSNENGERDVPPLGRIVAIAAGYYHNLVLTDQGQVIGWGKNTYGQALPPSGLTNVVAIAAGNEHGLVLQRQLSITSHPIAQSAIMGSPVTFHVQTSEQPPLPPVQYQWQKDGTNLLAQTNSWLGFDQVTDTDAGNYTVIVAGIAGQFATSSAAALTVSCVLDIPTTPGGVVLREPDFSLYPPHSVATLTATPAPGYGFIRWTGDATGSTNPLPVLMDTNKYITAVFASTALMLSSQGVGSIAKDPDAPFYAVDQQVALNATAGRWHTFAGWTDGNNENPRVVTIGESNAYTAVFAPITPLDTVTIGDVTRLAPIGMPAVVVDGNFILTESVSARGSAEISLMTTFPGGTILYTLDGSEPSFSSSLYTAPFRTTKTCLLRTIAFDNTFTQFVEGDPVTIVVLPTLTGLSDGGGDVAIEPPAGDYFSNSIAIVTAAAAPDWTFLQWLGDAEGNDTSVNLSMTRNKTARAVFGTSLTTLKVGGGNIVISPESSLYPYSTQVRLTAVPDAGNYLAFWAGATGGQSANPLLFTVTNANPQITAVFASLGSVQTNSLSVITDGRGHVSMTPSGNRFPATTNVVLQAIPEPNQEFLGWGGDASGDDNPLTVSMNTSKVIAASFTKRPRLSGEGTPDLLSQDGFRLTLEGEFRSIYELFGSADLVNWSLMGTVTNTWGTVQFTDREATTNIHRAYRARLSE